MIYKIITGIYLLKVMQAAMVYYNIKSINSVTWGKDCNMQNLQIRGEKLSPCLPVKMLHQKGVVFRCLIWGTEGTPGAVLSLERSPRWCLLLAIHCHFPNVTENLSLMNYHLFYQGHLEMLTCITIPLLNSVYYYRWFWYSQLISQV